MTAFAGKRISVEAAMKLSSQQTTGTGTRRRFLEGGVVLSWCGAFSLCVVCVSLCVGLSLCGKTRGAWERGGRVFQQAGLPVCQILLLTEFLKF